MNVDLRHLMVLVNIADAGSVTAAAIHLGVSQPSLSAQLTRIERSLGGPVFERRRKGVIPTPMGSVVIERARLIVKDVDSLVEDARRHSEGKRILRLAADPGPMTASLLIELERVLPERRVVPLLEHATSAIEQQLAAGDACIALLNHMGAPIGAPGRHEAVIVAEEPYVVAMASSHPAAQRPETSLEDLAEDNWLLPNDDIDGRSGVLLRAMRQRGIELKSPQGRQDLTTYWPYVAAGYVVALTVPTYIPPAGVITRPLAGKPICGRRTLSWNPMRVDDTEARFCISSAVRSYLHHLAMARTHHDWWDALPDQRPRLGDGRLAFGPATALPQPAGYEWDTGAFTLYPRQPR